MVGRQVFQREDAQELQHQEQKWKLPQNVFHQYQVDDPDRQLLVDLGFGYVVSRCGERGRQVFSQVHYSRNKLRGFHQKIGIGARLGCATDAAVSIDIDRDAHFKDDFDLGQKDGYIQTGEPDVVDGGRQFPPKQHHQLRCIVLEAQPALQVVKSVGKGECECLKGIGRHCLSYFHFPVAKLKARTPSTMPNCVKSILTGRFVPAVRIAPR